MTVRVACAQFSPQKAQVEANLDRIVSITEDATAEGVDLLVFPETATSGYFLEGGVLECSRTADELLARFQPVRLSRPMDVVLGFYERADEDLYNSCAYLSFDGQTWRMVHVYRKFFLPTYGVFDEARFVSRGTELGVCETRFGRIGLMICEDVWHSIIPTLSAASGATLLIAPAASPARGFRGELPGNLERWERLLQMISEEHSLHCLASMLCGFEGGKGFAGGSLIVDPMGQTIGRGPLHEEFLLVADLDLDLTSIARARSPLLGDLRASWADIVRIASEIESG